MRSIFAVVFVTPALLACSVPQFDPPHAPDIRTPEQLMIEGHYRRATQLIDGLPDGARHDYLQSRTLLAFRDLEAAMHAAEKALAADPKSAAYHVQLAAVAGRTAEHGAMFKQLSNAKRAKKELDEALALDPNNADALYGMVLYAWNAPGFMGGDKARARQLAEKLTAIDASRGYLLQANLAKERKDASDEETLLRKAVAADQKAYDAHVELASWALRVQPARLEVADDEACTALYLAPSRSEAWQILAELAATDECWPEVEGLIRIAGQFNPDNLAVEYKAAIAMIASGKNLPRAEALLLDYASHPPEGEAPSVGRARYQLGLALEKEGRKSESLAAVRMALDEDPTMDDAKKDLKRLSAVN